MGSMITASILLGRRTCFAATCLILSACSSQPVDVKPVFSFPTPLVEALPVTIAVYYSDEFQHYQFESLTSRQEASKQKSQSQASGKQTSKPTVAKPAKKAKKKKQPVAKGLRMALGAVQTPMLSNVLQAQFAGYEQKQQRDIGDADLLLEPKVLRFQYSSPKLTKLKVYEVWIKYRFSFYDRQNAELMHWDVPVYGKTPSAFMKSDAEAFAAAAEVAIRDMGAAFVTGLPRQVAFQQWLNESGNQRQEGAM